MVHALTEAHRVLKPNGILIDMRPAAVHRRVGLGAGKSWRFVGAMRELLDDDFAADRAVRQAVRNGYLCRGSRIEFNFDRVMDTLPDVRAWLDDFPKEKVPYIDSLYRKVERALATKPDGTKITLRGPLKIGLLRKIK
ncbi:MAG TPA: hypothetical protein VJ785_10425 [Anaerolineales bacterium]|nr:hypothetical protein [Anaerolineales bacterium]